MNYKRIILLDDNDTTLFVNTDVIDETYPNANVITYTKPEDFVKDALAKDEWFADETLLLLDLNMPGQFGYEVLEEIEEEREEMDDFHVIILTSSNLVRDLERSTRFTNIIGYIEKPLTSEKLTNALAGNF